jgi:hypothetical protein
MLADQGPNNTLVPSGIMARLLPARRTGMEAPGAMKHRAVAEIALEGADKKIPAKYADIGFDYGSNNVSFCRGTFKDCKGVGEPSTTLCEGIQDVWGQVINTTHGTKGPVFRVCFLKSSKPVDLWITRWNWQPLDEGMWVRCLNGCCSPKL